MIDIYYRCNIMSIIDNFTLLFYKLKSMSYYAIIEMPVNTTATDLILAHGARIAGNMKCSRKTSDFIHFSGL